VEELKTKLVAVPSSAPLTEVIATLKENDAYEVFIVEDSKTGIVSIRDVLRAKNIRSRKASSMAVQIPRLSAESCVSRAAALMGEYRVRALPIEHNDRVVGEITASSICKALNSRENLNFTIDKIMTSSPITLDVDDRLGKAKSLMQSRNIDHIPILEDGKTCGLLTSQRILDATIPPQKISKDSMTFEATGVAQLPVGGLMDTPLICDVHEGASRVLGRMIRAAKTCVLVGVGEELQGIVTYRDFVKLLAERKDMGIPVYMVGMPKDVSFDAEAARAKFVRIVTTLRRSSPQILEARSTIKTTSPQGKHGRTRYEVDAFVYTPRKIFVHSESGWDLASIFDVISDRLKKAMTRKMKRRQR